VSSLRTILSPFTTTVRSVANVGIKCTRESFRSECVSSEDAIVDLEARNTTSEQLEVGDYMICISILKADWGGLRGCNRTWKETRFHCPAGEFKEHAHDADGRQANTTLLTLKFSLTGGANSLLVT
jgi:hypothetical protein